MLIVVLWEVVLGIGGVLVIMLYVEVVQKVMLVVVNVFFSKDGLLLFDLCVKDLLFCYFFGDCNVCKQQDELVVNFGLGVIVSLEGYILMNQYVVDGVDQIEVVFVDGCMVIVKVIGSDFEIDFVVFKINMMNLLMIMFGCFDQLCVGDVVFVIGNLFGVGQMVMMGIISVFGCNYFGINMFENFIQIDVLINFGNFGGVLVDVNGNLFGINMVIYLCFGGLFGIGFVILVLIVCMVFESIIMMGLVMCGWIGVELQDVMLEIVELFGFQQKLGVIVVGVLQGGLVDKVGIKLGDILVSVNGEDIIDIMKLLNVVVQIKLGILIKVYVVCKGKQFDVNIVIGKCLLLLKQMFDEQDSDSE